jgi:hypothetical protein
VQRVHTDLWNQSPARPAPLDGWAPGNVLQGEAGAERLGTWVRFAALVEVGQVKDARVQVHGCPHTAAACRHVLAQLRGQPLATLAPGTPEQWRVAVAAPVEKLGQMLIIEDALTALCRAPLTRT